MHTLQQDMQEHPCIVFMDRDDEVVRGAIEELCRRQHVTFVHIADEQTAFQAQNKYLFEVRLVLLIERQFDRAYDIKLGTDAVVLIFAGSGSTTELPWPEAQ